MAAGALAVATIPVLGIDVHEVTFTPRKGFQITPMPVDMIESAFGLTQPKTMTDTQFREHIRKMVHDYHPVRIEPPLPMKIRNEPRF